MAKDKYNLTVKEQRFADEYMANGRNATQAYLKVQPNSGYDNARARGAEWSAKRNISEYIKDKTRERLEASNLTVNNVIDELINIGFDKKLKGSYRRFNKLTGEYDIDVETEFTAKEKERREALVNLAELLKVDEELESREDKISSYISTLKKVIQDG